MMKYVDVAPLDQIAPGSGTVVTVGDTAVALFHLGDRISGIADVCLRCGSSLAAGVLRGNKVKCSGCDWQYDVTTGAVNGIPALQIETFAVEVVDSHVMVADTLADARHVP